MSDAWKSYDGAPAPGARLCALSEVPEPGVLSLELDGFPLLLASDGAQIKAFVNACPHQFLPLDHRGRKLLSADGTVLRCSNHGAGFLLTTGEGVEGLGLGECLDPVPIDVREGTVFVAEEQS